MQQSTFIPQRGENDTYLLPKYEPFSSMLLQHQDQDKITSATQEPALASLQLHSSSTCKNIKNK
jgi:hypothetical protein